MARCPDCNKFVSNDYGDPEVNVDVNGDALTGDVRLVLLCAECNSEMAEATLDIDEPIEHDCEGEGEEEPEYELGDVNAENTDRYEDKDRHGKPIKSFRYMKHYYGAAISATVTCSKCQEEIEIAFTVEEQASAFEQMY